MERSWGLKLLTCSLFGGIDFLRGRALICFVFNVFQCMQTDTDACHSRWVAIHLRLLFLLQFSIFFLRFCCCCCCCCLNSHHSWFGSRLDFGWGLCLCFARERQASEFNLDAVCRGLRGSSLSYSLHEIGSLFGCFLFFIINLVRVFRHFISVLEF